MKLLPTYFLLLGIVIAGCSTTKQATAPAPLPPPVLVAPPPPSIPKPKTTPPKVLIIGDSHSDPHGNPYGTFGYLGTHLVELLPSVALYAASGAIPEWYIGGGHSTSKWGCTIARTGMAYDYQGCAVTTKLSSLIATEKPSILVVELGANLTGDSLSFVTAQVKGLLAIAPGIKCYWIGPPRAPTSTYSQTSQDTLEAELKSLTAPCTFISSKWFPYAGFDGEHENMATAKAWAEQIAPQIK